LIAATEVEETEPLGPVPQGKYLNQMVAVSTTLPARTLLAALHRIERAAGRVRSVKWGPRTLDLDIVMMEGKEYAEEGLIIPHPELPNRDFWQRQLAQLRGATSG
jgi:2-amino-4-hydroxy-6-hydroxymethyldihydropteridine diphosphokinase